MVDNNLIKPVVSNQTVTGLNPAKDREEKKKRQSFSERQKHQDELIEDEIIKSDGEKISAENTDKGPDKHSIDYCA